MNSVSGNEHAVQQRKGEMMIDKTPVRPGAVVKLEDLTTIGSERVRIPDPDLLIHLQFRRFAGCPICDLHLHSIARRYAEFGASSIREIAVFHSTAEELLPHARHLPFPVIADPDKRLYAQFGVESAARALLNPRALMPIVRGVIRSA